MHLLKFWFGSSLLLIPLALAQAADSFHIQAGAAHLSQGQEQLIGIQNSFGNIYTVNKGSDNVIVGGISYFLKPQIYKKVDIAFGISAYYLGETKTSGIVYLERNFPNLTYQYKTSHVPLYAAAKAVFKQKKLPVLIVADLGVGANFFNTKGYFETSRDNGITIPNQSFNGHTQTKFSAMGGIGFRFNQAINHHSIEIGYKYFYLNKGYLNAKPLILNQLSTKDIHAQAITMTLILE